MQKSSFKNVLLFLILGAVLSSCSQLFFLPRFGYLNKVAVTAHAETDTLVAHINEWIAIRNLQKMDTLGTRPLTSADNRANPEQLNTAVPGPIAFSLLETKRIFKHHPTLVSQGLRSDSQASAERLNGWVLGLLVFFGSLVLFAVLISWAIQEQKGCLASALAVFALLFEIWLVMFVLM